MPSSITNMSAPASATRVQVSPSDGALVLAAQAGDDRAFATLYLRHARHVANVVYRLTGNNEMLDDVVQDTFVLAMDRLGELREPERVRSWLVTIAVRRVRKHLARQAFRRALLVAIGVAAEDGRGVVAQDVADGMRLVERLPAKLRIPWMLHRVEGASLPETAEACEVSLATAKRRIAEAEERLERWTHGGR